MIEIIFREVQFYVDVTFYRPDHDICVSYSTLCKKEKLGPFVQKEEAEAKKDELSIQYKKDVSRGEVSIHIRKEKVSEFSANSPAEFIAFLEDITELEKLKEKVNSKRTAL